MILISVTWLGSADGPRYHGTEWPPAPLRVFQSLVASAGRRDEAGKQRGFEALVKLEFAPPPTIYAPEPRWAEPVASVAPNNDADRVWRELARGRLEKARKVEAKGKTIRRRRGRMVDGPIHYVWDADLAPEDVSVLSELADGVTHVGHGIDLATMTIRTGSPLLAGTVHRPDPRASNLLQIPYPDVLRILEERYLHERGRITGNGEGIKVAAAKRVVHVECGYASNNDILRNRYATYRLVVGTKTWLEPPERGLAVGAMLRHAIGQAAGRRGSTMTTWRKSWATAVPGESTPSRYPMSAIAGRMVESGVSWSRPVGMSRGRFGVLLSAGCLGGNCSEIRCIPGRKGCAGVPRSRPSYSTPRRTAFRDDIQRVRRTGRRRRLSYFPAWIIEGGGRVRNGLRGAF